MIPVTAYHLIRALETAAERTPKLKVLDLFSGIGGFSLGLERTGGFETVAFCEIEDYPRRVLKKHWPKVPIYDDVRTLTADALSRDGIAVDVICGGFPCQDISFAGAGAGLAGERSGLWREYARLVGELRPRFVIVENVSALLSRGLGSVLGDMAALGYDAEWHCIPASAVGAPHRRDRVWLVAHARGEQHESDCAEIGRAIAAQLYAAHAASERWQISREWNERHDDCAPRAIVVGNESRRDGAGDGAQSVADTTSNGRKPRRQSDSTQITGRRQPDRSSFGPNICNANVSGLAFRQSQSRDVGEELTSAFGADWWSVEPDVGRVAHGVPSRVDRLKGLGNAVVPQIPELIGRAILASIQAHPTDDRTVTPTSA